MTPKLPKLTSDNARLFPVRPDRSKPYQDLANGMPSGNFSNPKKSKPAVRRVAL